MPGVLHTPCAIPTPFSQDYVICEVFSTDEAECIDRSYVTTRSVPPPDLVDPNLEVIEVSIDGEWTAVRFVRPNDPLDEQDYDLDAVRKQQPAVAQASNGSPRRVLKAFVRSVLMKLSRGFYTGQC